MKKINFTAIPVEDIEGIKTPQNLSAAIGNMLFSMADDYDEWEFGREIYHATGEIEVDDKKEAILKKYLPMIKYNLRKSIETLLFS